MAVGGGGRTVLTPPLFFCTRAWRPSLLAHPSDCHVSNDVLRRCEGHLARLTTYGSQSRNGPCRLLRRGTHTGDLDRLTPRELAGLLVTHLLRIAPHRADAASDRHPWASIGHRERAGWPPPELLAHVLSRGQRLSSDAGVSAIEPNSSPCGHTRQSVSHSSIGTSGPKATSTR